jgi:hypothetical protein
MTDVRFVLHVVPGSWQKRILRPRIEIPVGSSASNSCGPPAKLSDRNTLLLAARDFTNLVGQPGTQSNAIQNFSGSSLRFSSGCSADNARHHRILEDSKFRQKMMKLKDKPDLSIPEIRKLHRIPLENIGSLEHHGTARRPVQTSK